MSQIICCHINETLVQGEITQYTPYDITVEITQPFAGFSTGCHIPCLIRSHKNYKGANGHQKAIELLSELYTALLAVKRKEKYLKSEINRPTGLLETVRQDREMQKKLTMQKRALRQDFRDRKISQREYQLQVKQIRKQSFELDMLIDHAQSTFFEKQVPAIQGILKPDQLIRFLAEA